MAVSHQEMSLRQNHASNCEETFCHTNKRKCIFFGAQFQTQTCFETDQASWLPRHLSSPPPKKKKRNSPYAFCLNLGKDSNLAL